jgi:hypothetical protein
MDCASYARVFIEELDMSKAAPGPGDRGAWDLEKDLKQVSTHVCLLPTVQTFTQVVECLDTTQDGENLINGVVSGEVVLNFLDQECTVPNAMPSWRTQFLNMMNNGVMALRNMNLQEWWELTNTYAPLTPMTKEDTTRFLKKLERGIGQASDAGQAHVANGCKVHWDKVAEFVAQRCWCEDFLLRSMCFHSILYVLHQQWVEPPAKWACPGSGDGGVLSPGRSSKFQAGSVCSHAIVP